MGCVVDQVTCHNTHLSRSLTHSHPYATLGMQVCRFFGKRICSQTLLSPGQRYVHCVCWFSVAGELLRFQNGKLSPARRSGTAPGRKCSRGFQTRVFSAVYQIISIHIHCIIISSVGEESFEDSLFHPHPWAWVCGGVLGMACQMSSSGSVVGPHVLGLSQCLEHMDGDVMPDVKIGNIFRVWHPSVLALLCNGRRPHPHVPTQGANF